MPSATAMSVASGSVPDTVSQRPDGSLTATIAGSAPRGATKYPAPPRILAAAAPPMPGEPALTVARSAGTCGRAGSYALTSVLPSAGEEPRTVVDDKRSPAG